MTRYRIDPERSWLWIEAKSSVHAIHSETKGLEGTFEAELGSGGGLAPSTTPAGRLELAVRLLSSGNPVTDLEMKRRIDARRYPTISGVLTTMKETGRSGRYLVAGEVTFRGQTVSVEDEMDLSQPDDDTVQLEGQHVFDIRDFGMNPPRILTLRVHPEVSVRVRIVATASD
jgi:hypothetical protein